MANARGEYRRKSFCSGRARQPNQPKVSPACARAPSPNRRARRSALGAPCAPTPRRRRRRAAGAWKSVLPSEPSREGASIVPRNQRRNCDLHEFWSYTQQQPMQLKQVGTVFLVLPPFNLCERKPTKVDTEDKRDWKKTLRGRKGL